MQTPWPQLLALILATAAPAGAATWRRNPAMAACMAETRPLQQAIRDEPFAGDRIGLIATWAEGRPLRSCHAASIIVLFHYDEDRLAALTALAPLLVDDGQQELILILFPTAESRAAALSLLRG